LTLSFSLTSFLPVAPLAWWPPLLPDLAENEFLLVGLGGCCWCTGSRIKGLGGARCAAGFAIGKIGVLCCCCCMAALIDGLCCSFPWAPEGDTDALLLGEGGPVPSFFNGDGGEVGCPAPNEEDGKNITGDCKAGADCADSWTCEAGTFSSHEF
jgi:hypothetical protein